MPGGCLSASGDDEVPNQVILWVSVVDILLD